MNQTGFAIQTHSLTKRFRRLRAVDDVNANIPTGSIYGLMGPNGAGKTTFVRLLLNLIDPTSGSATVLGHDVVKEPVKVRQRVGHVAALQPLWEWMTVRGFAGFMAGCYPKWNPDAVSTVLDRIGIDENATLGVLSRGHRELRIQVKPPHLPPVHPQGRIEVVYLPRNPHIVIARVEIRYRRDATLAAKHLLPYALHLVAQATHRPYPCYNHSASVHFSFRFPSM